MQDAERFSRRLVVGFGLVVLFNLAAAAISMRALGRAGELRHSATRTYAERVELLDALRADVAQIVSAGRVAVLSDTVDRRARLDEAEVAFHARLGALPGHVPRDELHASMVHGLRLAGTDYVGTVRRVALETPESSPLDTVGARYEREVVPLRVALEDQLDELVEYHEDQLTENFERAWTQASNAWVLALAMLGGAAAASAALASLTTRTLRLMYGRQLEAVARATAATEARDEMLAVVAHDLRNPLQAIAMKSALVRRRIDDPGPQAHLAAIERIVTRMDHLIRSLIDAASVDVGRLSVQPRPTPVAALIDDAFELLEVAATDKGLHLRRGPVAAGARAMADPERIVEVLSNLIGNAIKFTPGGGTIEVSAVADGDMIAFAVADTGLGIDPRYLPRIFDRYWKGGPGSKKGAGLGLYISRGIVTAHQGHIWVDSLVGRGSTFRFTIPAA